MKASVQQPDGRLIERVKGTPQGVISSLLANLYLHYAMDEWLRIKYPHAPFERYADDSVVHCRTEREAKEILHSLKERLLQCGLELHPGKTKNVYCKDDDRRGDFPNTKFNFLGYTFRNRRSKNRLGKYFVNFSPAVSNSAKKLFVRRCEDGRFIYAVIRHWKIFPTCLILSYGGGLTTMVSIINLHYTVYSGISIAL